MSVKLNDYDFARRLWGDTKGYRGCTIEMWSVRLEWDKCHWGKCQRKYAVVSHSHYVMLSLALNLSERTRTVVEIQDVFFCPVDRAHTFCFFFCFVFSPPNILIRIFFFFRASRMCWKLQISQKLFWLTQQLFWPSCICLTCCLVDSNRSGEYRWAFQYTFHYSVHFTHCWAVLISLRNHCTRAE